MCFAIQLRAWRQINFKLLEQQEYFVVNISPMTMSLPWCSFTAALNIISTSIITIGQICLVRFLLFFQYFTNLTKCSSFQNLKRLFCVCFSVFFLLLFAVVADAIVVVVAAVAVVIVGTFPGLLYWWCKNPVKIYKLI